MNYQPAIAVQILGAALAAWLLTGCSSVPVAQAGLDAAQAEAQIRHRLEEVINAAETRDFKRLDSYHLYGPQFTKFTGSSPHRLDAAAAQKGEHDGLGAVQGLNMRAQALQVDVFGQVGIATFILDCSFESGGAVVHRQERSTLIFVRDGAEWKIAHEHLSPIDR